MTSAAVGGIVVAAGRGERFGASLPKALQPLGGRPLLAHACQALIDAGVGPLVVAAPPDRVDEVADVIASMPALVVAGGETRQQSVAAALGALDPGVRWVLVHDAARALAPAELAVAVIDALQAGAAAVVPGLPVVDTIKSVAGGRVTATIDRAQLVAVQTPQGFEAALLRAAHARAASEPADAGASDDAGMIEAMGHVVHVVAGAPEALKITRPLDLAVAELLLRGAGS